MTSGATALANAVVSTAGTSTITDVNGNYSLALDIATYNVTASLQPVYYDSTVTGISVTEGNTWVQDFDLGPEKPEGAITGSVTNV